MRDEISARSLVRLWLGAEFVKTQRLVGIDLNFGKTYRFRNLTKSSVHVRLVEPKKHSRDLIELIEMQISASIIDYTVKCVEKTVSHAIHRPLKVSAAPAGVQSIVAHGSRKNNSLGCHWYIDRAKPLLQIASAYLCFVQVRGTCAKPSLRTRVSRRAQEEEETYMRVMAELDAVDDSLDDGEVEIDESEVYGD
ncbi:hypothetical protein B0H13DRAFT_1882356 [Mycena leptocephala]|nr:hypothetical protein B0H13DRAFT_1882356 [Mycena leptocephala]